MTTRARPVPAELTTFLAPYPDVVRATALALRRRVLGVFPNAHEFVWDATNAVSLVYTPTVRWQDGVVHIASYGSRVNLGFNHGAALADPLGILGGTGTRIRHVSFTTAAAVAGAPWIVDYLHAAAAHAGMPLDAGDRGTTVRTSTGSRRRPS